MWDSLTKKHAQLQELGPLGEAAERNLREWFKIELTYTSNAIEGNTLTRQETALVVEKGLTVGGKTLNEQLEARNHAEAFDSIHKLRRKPSKQTWEQIICHIHAHILRSIDDENAGQYRKILVRIAGSTIILPNWQKVPQLMRGLSASIADKTKDHPVKRAALAHYDLVSIHPFIDGNGRTARLLMNLILLRAGYPIAIIRKRDRLSYINRLEQSQLGGSIEPYLKFIAKSVERSLDIVLDTHGKPFKKTNIPTEKATPCLELLGSKSSAREAEDMGRGHGPRTWRIGELANLTNLSVATIRFWTKEGLLQIADTTDSGYQLYDRKTLKRIALIKKLKAKRLTLKEIAAHILELKQG